MQNTNDILNHSENEPQLDLNKQKQKTPQPFNLHFWLQKL